MAAEHRRARRRTSTSRAGSSRPSFALTREERAVDRAQPAGRARRADRRARAALGGRADAALPAVPRRRVARCETNAARGTKIQMRARFARAAAALPPREDDRDRRPDRLRRRDRPHLDGGDRFDSAESPRPWRRRLARRRACGSRGRPSRTWPSTSGCAGTRCRRRDASGPEQPPEPAGDVELQIVRTVPERIYRRCRDGDFSHPRVVRRCAALGASDSIYLENQFLWSPEIVDDPRRQAAPPADRRLPAAGGAAGAAERRGRRHPRPCSAS